MKKFLLSMLFTILTSTSLFAGWVINDTFTAYWDTDLNATTVVAYELENSDEVCTSPTQHRMYFHVVDGQGYTSKQYRRSGYDRGHLASHRSFACNKKKLPDLYNMVNVVPMTPKTNRHLWYKYEQLERYMATAYKKVFVVNTVYYDDGKVVKGMRIPTMLKKCIYYGEDKHICLEATNRSEDE